MDYKNCFILGSRPGVIKLAPLILKMNSFVIHTGQHRELAREMFKFFKIEPNIDLDLMQENQSLSDFISKCIEALERTLKKRNFQRIWVQGDTSTAFVGALIAFIHRIPLIHVEAGLRTYNKENPFPEEIFRHFIDLVADYHFCPTERSFENLKREGNYKNAYVVGNTVVDTLEMIKEKLPEISPIKEKYVLATIHRRESFGKDMYEIFSALKELSKRIKIILPAHPNPNVRKIIKKVNLKIIEPLSYFDFLWHLKFCEYIITDSGGVQEEAPSFEKKVIVLRKFTERQESVDLGYAITIKNLKKNIILKTIQNFISQKIIFNRNPFGDGNASGRILKIINEQRA